ncbi:MAG: metal-dependent hydrolase [Deltaproteobacteria bacterium CG11_big_fil_rev_8_21_14_0_20_47_16]|nr:MAG: metal-dependent hydrolase [Deltaproteobacteria bacterium CG11_big_fil_rev_8_21_14_0_20_47_16]
MIQIDSLIRSRRRSIGLRITPDAKLVVRAPLRASQRWIDEVLERKRSWILAQQAAMRERLQEMPKPLPKSYIRDYKKQALQIIASRVRFYAIHIGVSPKVVKVNNAQRRWGSCSHRGSLNFSYRLIFAPLPVLDYVVVHELAHMKHLNHSQAFWAVVATILPDYKKHHRWLKQNGHRLG